MHILIKCGQVLVSGSISYIFVKKILKFSIKKKT